MTSPSYSLYYLPSRNWHCIFSFTDLTSSVYHEKVVGDNLAEILTPLHPDGAKMCCRSTDTQNLEDIRELDLKEDTKLKRLEIKKL